MANNGDLSCTELQVIETTLQAKWGPNNAYDAQKQKVNDETLNAILTEQTARFEEIENKSVKSRKVDVQWLESCPIGTKDCDVTCTDPTTGIEFGTRCVEYDVTGCVQANTIKISDEKLRTSSITFAEMVADAVFQADKAIVEKLNLDAIDFLDANTKANLNPNTWGNRVTPAAGAGAFTTLAPTILTDPFNYYTQTATINRFNDPYIVGGNIMSKYLFNEASESNQAYTGEGFISVRGWRHYLDYIMDVQLSPDEKLFMVNRGEVAYVNAYYYPEVSNPKRLADGKIAYRLQSPLLSAMIGYPIYHDVVYTTSCTETNGVLSLDHYWEIVNRHNFFLSPSDCDDHNRLLGFTCG